MKFLIIQTAFLGDVVLATPLIEKIHRFFPSAEIHLLVRKGNEGLLRNHPILTKTWVWDKGARKYQNLFRLATQFRKERFFAVVNCQRFAASGLLTLASGAAHRIGFDKNPFSWAFSHRAPHRIGQGHEVDRNLSLIEHLSDQSTELPRLYPDAEALKEAQVWKTGVSDYYCLAPTSVWFTKQWPAHKWVELIAALPPEAKVYLLGAPSDRIACQNIADAISHPKVVNLAGQLSLLGSAALMQGAKRNFVNDSAPLHLASAVNAPVTAIFCSTLPSFGFTPLSTDHRIVETTIPLPCRPCGLHGKSQCPEGHFRCAEYISISEVCDPLP
ncbi:MAG: glycosyltransferase family 9 protein [Bacteroidetes bacterium]|nr:glycosyltransferase family 9 protein [Bacteroidota bacterium]